jgi:hypothetical protein
MTSLEPGQDHDAVVITLVYDTLHSGGRAMEVYQSLLQNLRHECELDLKLCLVEDLCSHEAHEPALAENSDLIILALDKNKPVPAKVREWLAAFPRENTEETALGLLLTGKEPGTYAHEIKHEVAALAVDRYWFYFCGAGRGRLGNK